MKVPKTLLQTIAVALAVTTVNSACSDINIVKPKKKSPEDKQQPYSCPACGMG